VQFEVTDNNEPANCKVVQSEALGGFLSVLSFIYGPFMKNGFKRMNEALKIKAEALAAAGES